IWERVKAPKKKSWMQAIYKSGLSLATGFPTSMHYPEFILAVVAQFDKESMSVNYDDDKVVICLDPNFFEDLLKLPD
ncbi:hypothetical protein KI387_000896, partial [Taxus chinensis]